MDENIIYNADGIFIINFSNTTLNNNDIKNNDIKNNDITNNEKIYMKPIQNIVNTNNLNYNYKDIVEILHR